MNDLRDRVVLITGASTGIGAAAALAFARAGCRLALYYNQSADQARAVESAAQAHGAQTLLTQGDLRHADVVPRIVGDTMERFGRIYFTSSSHASIRSFRDRSSGRLPIVTCGCD